MIYMFCNNMDGICACFVAKSFQLQFTLFCREINFVAI